MDKTTADLLIACRLAAGFLDQQIPGGGGTRPLSQRLAGLGGAYVARQLRDAIAAAEMQPDEDRLVDLAAERVAGLNNEFHNGGQSCR